MKAQKKTLLFILWVFPLTMYCQYGSSDHFNFTVSFTKDISAKEINISYYEMERGNILENISIATDTINNKIKISGINHFIGGYPFPTFTFSIKQKKNQNELDKTFNFYFINELSTFDDNSLQDVNVFFSYENPVTVLKYSMKTSKYVLEKLPYIGLNVSNGFTNTIIQVK